MFDNNLTIKFDFTRYLKESRWQRFVINIFIQIFC